MEWIKCSDRMPDNLQPVLIYTPSKLWLCPIATAIIELGCWASTGNDENEVSWLEFSDVTHWMPLPEAPKESQ